MSQGRASVNDLSSFSELGLPEPLLRALRDEGYAEPTSIQQQAIPSVLAGRDVLGTAKTGTGKTAAFLVPLLARLGASPPPGVRVLVVSPTRELAAQIGERAAAYGRHLGLRHLVIYGGVNQRRQEQGLAAGPSLVVATPGRLLDLVQQRVIDLRKVEALVLDEADRMLDMGFLPDVRRIVAAVGAERQTLLFSATMPKEIAELARRLLRDPVRVSADPPSETPAVVDQTVLLVPREEKRGALLRLLREDDVERAIVFMRTKRGANRLAEQLTRAGISALAIHGNKSQNARDRALEAFRAGSTPVLVATDLAARGIDVKGVSHVINFEMPDTPESYVHRIGRTGRAGAEGKAISLIEPEERAMLRDIERTLATRIPTHGDAARVDRAPAAVPVRAPGAVPVRAPAAVSVRASAAVPVRASAAVAAPAPTADAPRRRRRRRTRRAGPIVQAPTGSLVERE